MLKYIFLAIPILLLSCKGEEGVSCQPVFTIADSTATVHQIMDSLRAELYDQWFMMKPSVEVTCGIPPKFDPVLSFEIDEQGEWTVRNQKNPTHISEEVVRFYHTNWKKDRSGNEDARYSVITQKEIEREMVEVEKEILAIKQSEQAPAELIQFKQLQLDEWRKKYRVFQTISLTKIRQPHYQTGISLDYPKDTKGVESILDSLLLGFYQLREWDSQEYFKESYAQIVWRATKEKDTLAMDRMNALTFLHPVQLLVYPMRRDAARTEIPVPPVQP